MLKKRRFWEDSMQERLRIKALRTSVVGLVAWGALALGGCVTVPMGSEEVVTLRSSSVDVGILVKARRDPILILESEFDQYSTWASNRGPGDTCVAYRYAAGSPVSEYWVVPAGEEIKLYEGQRFGGTYSAHASVTDPTCTSWN
jgi:hypothetical protein